MEVIWKGAIDVGSSAVSLAALVSPPPETVALLVTREVAVLLTSTVTVPSAPQSRDVVFSGLAGGLTLHELRGKRESQL
jgi:hypothetical protein